MEPNPKKNIGHLAREVIHGSKELIQQEAKLFESEMREKMETSGRHLILLSIGGMIAMAGLIFFGLGFVHLLVTYLKLSVWGAHLVIGAVCLAGSSILIWRSNLTVYPEKTIESLKENFECLKTQIS